MIDAVQVDQSSSEADLKSIEIEDGERLGASEDADNSETTSDGK